MSGGPVQKGQSPVQRGDPSMVKSNASWVMITWDPSCEEADMAEKITFLQLRWRVVMTLSINDFQSAIANEEKSKNCVRRTSIHFTSQ